MLTGNVSGAVASGTTSAAALHLNALGQELGDVGKAVLDIGAGMAIGAATGGGTAAVSAGGNTDWYNRQLHPSELDWIRNNAEAFAKEQGISVAEAEQRLIERAAQRVDYAWSKMIDSQDAAADSFLSSASAMKGDVPSSSAVSFINSDGKAQNLFSTSGDEYYSTGKYSNLAAKYNRENNQFLTNILVPKVKNNLVFEGVKDGGNALSEAARAALDSPIETTKNVVKTVEHSLSDCLKNPATCATEKWTTFDTSSGDLLRTHYNQADVNALYGKDMTAETALVPLMRGGTVVAEVLPVVKAGSVAVKSVDNMLSPLAKGVDANEKLPVVGKTEGYENQTSKISSSAENIALYPKLKEQLQAENLQNIAKLDPVLGEIVNSLGKELNYGISKLMSAKEAERLGRLWVGYNFTEVKVKNTVIGWNSVDRLRGYRFPSVKESDYAETGVQANFETYKINPVTNQKEKVGNAHLNIIEN